MFKQHKPEITEAFQTLYRSHPVKAKSLALYIDVSEQAVHKWLKKDAYVPRYALRELGYYIKEGEITPVDPSSVPEPEADLSPEEKRTSRLMNAHLNETLGKSKRKLAARAKRQEASYAKADGDSHIEDATHLNLGRL